MSSKKHIIVRWLDIFVNDDRFIDSDRSLVERIAKKISRCAAVLSFLIYLVSVCVLCAIKTKAFVVVRFDRMPLRHTMPDCSVEPAGIFWQRIWNVEGLVFVCFCLFVNLN